MCWAGTNAAAAERSQFHSHCSHSSRGGQTSYGRSFRAKSRRRFRALICWNRKREVEQFLATRKQKSMGFEMADWLRRRPAIACSTLGTPVPDDWPRPYLLQEFVRLEVPEVFRLYAVGGETFGWNARRFPRGAKSSPFVAHAQGAQYELETGIPPEAAEQARRALSCTQLLDSFGCADLMRDSQRPLAGARSQYRRRFQSR